MRDITLEDTIRIWFTTRAFATGVPTVLAGTPVLSVLEENNATPITAGVSISVDRASVVGLNEATIVATAANGYEAGKGYSLYISTGTVASVSVVGEVVGQFTIGASAAAVDLANVTDGLGALSTDIADVPTVAEFNARTLVAASYFDPAADTVVNVTTVATTTTNTDMRGTDSALLAASAPTNFGDLAITVTTGLVTVGTNNDKTGYSISGTKTTLDALNDILATAIVSAGAITTASGAVSNVTTVATTTTNTDMRGTDSAALASVATEARLSELDAVTAGKMANQVDIIQTDTTTDIPATITTLQSDTDDIQTRLPAALVGSRMDSNASAINNSATAAVQLALSANSIEDGAAEGVPSTTVIQTDLAETQDDIYIGRVVIFTSGAARGEASDITDYTGSTGTLTVTALANAPAAADTFILI